MFGVDTRPLEDAAQEILAAIRGNTQCLKDLHDLYTRDVETFTGDVWVVLKPTPTGGYEIVCVCSSHSDADKAMQKVKKGVAQRWGVMTSR